MGVLPLQFQSGANAASLELTGRERFDVIGIGAEPDARAASITVRATGDDGTVDRVHRRSRASTRRRSSSPSATAASCRTCSRQLVNDLVS